MKRCVVFTYFSGNIKKLSKKLKFDNEDFFICADSGYKTAEMLGVKPNLVVGDFDSYEKSKIPPDITLESVKKEKDETDTFLAAMKGLSLGFEEFIIVGGLGGRMDHAFANISLLKFLIDKKATAEIISDDCSVKLLKAPFSLCVENKKDKIYSLFAFGKEVKGATLNGFKYPLYNYTLENSFPLGISNVVIEDKAEISATNGELLIFYNIDDDKL